MSPRIRLLREILAKFGKIGPVSPELAQKLRRYAPPARLNGRPRRNATRTERRGKDADRGR